MEMSTAESRLGTPPTFLTSATLLGGGMLPNTDPFPTLSEHFTLLVVFSEEPFIPGLDPRDDYDC